MRDGIVGAESVLSLGWMVALRAEHNPHLGTQRGSATLEHLGQEEEGKAQDAQPTCRRRDV